MSNVYNQPCWCKWPCSGIMPGKFGSLCSPLISNLMLLFTLIFALVKFNSGSMLVGATLSSVVEGVSGGSTEASVDRSWSWLWVCSWRDGWMDWDFSGTLGRVGTLDALCNVCTRTKREKIFIGERNVVDCVSACRQEIYFSMLFYVYKNKISHIKREISSYFFDWFLKTRCRWRIVGRWIKHGTFIPTIRELFSFAFKCG